MPALSYSTSLIAGTNENVNDVQSLFNQVRDVVNALDNDNIAIGAAIDYAKIAKPVGGIPFTDLPDLNVGQFLVGDGSHPKAATMGGAQTVDVNGNISHSRQSVVQGADQNMPVGGTVVAIPGCSFSPGSGTWLLLGKVTIKKGDAGGIAHLELRLRDSALAVLDLARAGAIDTTGNEPVTTLNVQAVYSGGNQVLLDGYANAFSGANCVATQGKLVGVRLA